MSGGVEDATLVLAVYSWWFLMFAKDIQTLLSAFVVVALLSCSYVCLSLRSFGYEEGHPVCSPVLNNSFAPHKQIWLTLTPRNIV